MRSQGAIYKYRRSPGVLVGSLPVRSATRCKPIRALRSGVNLAQQAFRWRVRRQRQKAPIIAAARSPKRFAQLPCSIGKTPSRCEQVLSPGLDGFW